MKAFTALSPCTGVVVAAADLEDTVFAAEMLGPSIGLQPRNDESSRSGNRLDPSKDAGPSIITAFAPIDGDLIALKPHAFAIRTAGGFGVLVHLGIDTVGTPELFQILRNPNEPAAPVSVDHVMKPIEKRDHHNRGASETARPWTQGDKISAGQPVIDWDLTATEAAGFSTAVMIAILELPTDATVKNVVPFGQETAAGVQLLEISVR